MGFFDWKQNQSKGIERSRVGGVNIETSAWLDQTMGLDFQVQRTGRSLGTPAFF